MEAIDTRAYQSRLGGLWKSAENQINQGTLSKPVKIVNSGGWSCHETLGIAKEKWHVLHDNRKIINQESKPANPEDVKLIKKMLRNVRAATAA